MRNVFIAAAALSVMALASAGTTMAAEHIEAGKLDCDVSAGVGLIITEKQDVSCVFTPVSGSEERYSGQINEFGIDVGTISKAKMAWLVYAPVSRDKGSLDGTYTGVSADAAVGIGLGANVLVGGQHGTVSLQPISIKAEEGLNVAVAISALTLHTAK